MYSCKALPHVVLLLAILSTGVALQRSAWAAPRMVILQFGNQGAINAFHTYTETVKSFATANGFEHRLQVLPEGRDLPFYKYQKAIKVQEAMDKLHKEQWLLVADLDVAIKPIKATRKDFDIEHWSLRSRRTHIMGDLTAVRLQHFFGHDAALGGRCDFIAQDADHVVNAGLLAFRSSDVGRNLVKKWLERATYIRTHSDGHFADQCGLMSALLFMAEPGYNGTCDDEDGPKRKNKCWKRHMDGVGKEVDHRTFGTYCLLPSSKHFNLHDVPQGPAYLPTDPWFHGKDPSLAGEFCKGWKQAGANVTC